MVRETASPGAQRRASTQQFGLPDPSGIRIAVCCFHSGCALTPTAHCGKHYLTRTLIPRGTRNWGTSPEAHRHIHVLKGPIHDAAGNIVGIQGMFWDVTGLQPPPHPQCIELPDPRRLCGRLCSSGCGYASRTQPNYQPRFSHSTWCKDRGVVNATRTVFIFRFESFASGMICL